MPAGNGYPEAARNQSGAAAGLRYRREAETPVILSEQWCPLPTSWVAPADFFAGNRCFEREPVSPKHH